MYVYQVIRVDKFQNNLIDYLCEVEEKEEKWVSSNDDETNSRRVQNKMGVEVEQVVATGKYFSVVFLQVIRMSQGK